jgi:hypothetical protein
MIDFEFLPNEILLNIFSYLTSNPRSCAQVALTSTRMCDLIFTFVYSGNNPDASVQSTPIALFLPLDDIGINSGQYLQCLKRILYSLKTIVCSGSYCDYIASECTVHKPCDNCGVMDKRSDQLRIEFEKRDKYLCSWCTITCNICHKYPISTIISMPNQTISVCTKCHADSMTHCIKCNCISAPKKLCEYSDKKSRNDVVYGCAECSNYAISSSSINYSDYDCYSRHDEY